MKRINRPAGLLFLPLTCLLLALGSTAQEPAPAPGPPAPAPAPAPTPSPQPKPDPGQPAPAKPEPKSAPVVPPPAKIEEKRPAPVTVVPAPPKKKTVADVTKNCDEIKGLFTLHRDRENGNAFLFIKKKQLEQEFIYFSHTVEGVLAAGHNRGQFHDEMVFTMKRRYDKIEFIRQNTAFYFDPLHPLSRAAGANTSHAILAAETIAAENEEGYLLNAGGLFLKETILQVKPSTGGDGKSFWASCPRAKPSSSN